MTDRSDVSAERELAAIRARTERIPGFTALDDETTLERVARMATLTEPESAGRAWLARWQVSEQMNNALRKALADVLTAVESGEEVPSALVDEAWAVLSDVQTIIPAAAGGTQNG